MSRSKPPGSSKLDLRGNASPDRVVPAANGVFVWLTIIVVWLVSLLPWRVWGAAPDMLLLTIAFWCVNQPSRVGLLTAFVFGLLMDIHDAGLMGELALYYTLVAYGAVVLNRRLQRFDLLGQAIHLLPVFFAAKFFTILLHAWIAGRWPGWDWALGVLLTIAIYPLWGFILQLPQRGSDDTDSANA